MEPVRLFVASDPRMGDAERALECSIRENTTGPVEITWMRAGDPGWVCGPDGDCSTWNIGREPGLPYSRLGWATDFTGFRWAIPELCDFRGRAIYQDTDMLDLGDMRELFEMPMKTPVLCAQGKACVMLLDCEAFCLMADWPSLAKIKALGGKCMYQLRSVLDQSKAIDKSLSRDWNSPDKLTPSTKVLHFTNMHTQPWKPWPEHFSYPPHRDKHAVKLFHQYLEKAKA